MAALELAKPSSSYVRHAYLTMAGLLVFLALYLGLTGFFIASALRILPIGWWSADFALLGLGIADLLFALALARGLLFFRRASAPQALEITAADEPRLFAFLDQLVARAGAPRPHRVFLSHEVNAAVVYDLSILNLIWPTRKNLVIGVGLVNSLSLGELEAVLAHEFGHFAQRSMAVGRWVYVAQQIAGQVVLRRGALDEALEFFSDPRLALIGWPLRLTVWSLRSTIDIVLRGVVVAERALSREMEFQADQVAVALTGSDAPVHALHRCIAAEEALDAALDIAVDELRCDRVVADLYELQTQARERLALIFDDPAYGHTPTASSDPAHHRVFEHERAQPPRMWATHPSNRAREDRAKAHYVAQAIDERPAWVLFRAPEQVRRAVTRHFFERFDVELEQLEQLDVEHTATLIEQCYGSRWFDPRYRGVYLGRSCVRSAERVEQLFDAQPPAHCDFDALYPASLRDALARWKDLMVERALLEAMHEGRLRPPDGVIRHRGRPLRPREVLPALAELDAECEEARARLSAHDRACRTMHALAARSLGEDWAAYHRSVVALLHYADHAEADLVDARRHLQSVIAYAHADDRVTDAERRQILESADDLHRVMRAIHDQAEQIVLPEAVAQRLAQPSWTARLGEPYTNPAPNERMLDDWLDAVGGWCAVTADALDVLERACLQVLLELEANLESCVRAPRELGPAPTPARVPSRYAVLPPGRERQQQTKLDLWNRFYLARGWGPAIVRTLVALTIVGGVLFGSFIAGRAF